MAIGWLTVLSQVPWTEVINNAPKVADGAKKLWKSVSGKSSVASTPKSASQVPASAEALSPVAMEARIRELEEVVGELHAQMVASSELMKQLAEQNTQLVQRIEANRVRTLWLAALSVAGLVIAVVALSSQA
ncbi:MAG: hypothetical protein A3G29_08425 [Burkholderiales bacterium RIFCSPLOWO2_12_FULL_64_99]|jgi:hypothetical protein|uniref:hypothetical protein n=1 Tax=Aquabacterium sp. TaxID=1872578 RepID=UPI0008C3825A|nr:hypothetical protein [Aquabacterium sp.]OGB01250.1 MAG: hypothetical protein A3E52_01775 [Burkholderiales bacterium RIFCSPHIGHO2_12_FULL_63_20]OGB62212.1 MAG: hypothetical protein A3G29_08425 [Burkholderiales bacterium RIFCSPLOWO2_12_FULL_64_99]